jgi:hypothetical protein
MAISGRLDFQIQRSTVNLGTHEISRQFSQVLPRPAMKKVRHGQRSAPVCQMTITRPAMTEGPKSPGKEKRVPTEAPISINKGWSDNMDRQDQRLVDQLRNLATLASDRSEMHHILSLQRDNWNSLFHTTITMASVSTAVVAALNGAQPAVGLSVVASGLGLTVAAFMALVNFFQPSQLAEEQSHAARFFKRLATDIESTLEIDPRMRPEASHYLQQKLATLHALDSAFPMPLTPVVLEKFPKVIAPSILSGPAVDLAQPEVSTSSSQYSNGWTPAIEKDLKRTAQILHDSDIPTYLQMATGVNHLNKALAIASNVMATAAALLNVIGAMPGIHTSALAAAMSVGAFFAHNLSHAATLGAAYETYRNCAGYYADLESSIQRALRTPVSQREDGMLFLQKISLQLGRNPAALPMVPEGQKTAGTLF